MLAALLNSRVLFRILLAVPAVVLLSRFQLGTGGFGHLIQGSGEWSARLLIAVLCVTPLRLIFRGRHWPMWLFKRRRDLGAASFLYAVLHLSAYAVKQGSLGLILADFGSLGLWIWSISGGWTQLSGANPDYIFAGDFTGTSKREIMADFGSLGLWMWSAGTWTQISPLNPD